VSRADSVLLVANVLYGTSYLGSRLALDAIPPATLALARLILGAAVLGALAARPRGRRASSDPATPACLDVERRSAGDGWRIAWMGILGFSAAYACSHYGLANSTVTNAALLIVVEPVSLIALAPVVLGERPKRAEAAGGALALLGMVLVVVNGVPGVTEHIAPHWQGDVLLVVAGVAFASYTLIGRDVLARREPLGVTVWSIVWGAAGIAPLALGEWLRGHRPSLTTTAFVSTLYVGVVISGLGYLLWNWAVQRVAAPRAAIFLTVQPVVGVLLGAIFAGDRVTVFTIAGGALIVLGLACTVRGPREERRAIV
jgi:drug/metabolite transporter (DMT)-like permease